MKFLPVFLMLALTAALSGCATGYGKHTMAGNFYEKQLGESVYIVSYDGSGNTSSDKVWYFWIYRCAELTRQKGFDNFSLSPVIGPGMLDENGRKLASESSSGSGDGQGWRMIKTKGGSAPVMIYTPGYTVTTWHSKGVVTMFRTLPPLDAKVGYRAQAILDQLHDYIETNGQAVAAPRMTILGNAGFAVTPWTIPPI